MARHAFGPGMEVLTNMAIFVYLLFVLCGFMVLIKGIWSPIVLSVAVHYVPDARTTKHSDDAVLLLAVVLTLPLFLSQDLHGLR